MFPFVFVFSISQGSKNKPSSVENGGGGYMVAISSPSPKCYRLPIYIYNFVSFDYNLTFSYTAAILDSKMVSIIVFSNYVDVEQIYVHKIGQTYIIATHINRVFAFYKVESIITWAFSELLRVHGGHLE